MLLVEEVLLVEDDELVTGRVGPQNCTLETSGVFPLPTFGSPELEKLPSNCGGASHNTTDAGPPFTTMAVTPNVEWKSAPVADASDKRHDVLVPGRLLEDCSGRHRS